jgi:hypothetical protein
MPSSSASVAATPRSRPAAQVVLELAALLGQVPGAVGGDLVGEGSRRVGRVAEPFLRRHRHHLGALPAAGEDQRLDVGPDEPGEQVGGLAQHRAAGGPRLVVERWLPQAHVERAAR